VLKEAIQAGKINLTAIVNTHQYVLPSHFLLSEANVSSHWDHAGGNKKLASPPLWYLQDSLTNLPWTV
jgi:hydroxyacylglutathione hydrolase